MLGETLPTAATAKALPYRVVATISSNLPLEEDLKTCNGDRIAKVGTVSGVLSREQWLLLLRWSIRSAA